MCKLRYGRGSVSVFAVVGSKAVHVELRMLKKKFGMEALGSSGRKSVTFGLFSTSSFEHKQNCSHSFFS